MVFMVSGNSTTIPVSRPARQLCGYKGHLNGFEVKAGRRQQMRGVPHAAPSVLKKLDANLPLPCHLRILLGALCLYALYVGLCKRADVPGMAAVRLKQRMTSCLEVCTNLRERRAFSAVVVARDRW